MREKRRAYFVVGVDLDEIPGWGHEPQDHQDSLVRHLQLISHYFPTVTPVVKLQGHPFTYEATGPTVGAYEITER